METLFEGSYIRNKDFAKEFFNYHAYRRPLGIFITVIGIWAIVTGIMCVIGQQYWAIFSIVLGVYLFILREIRTRKSIKLMLERDKEGNHGNVVSVQNLVTENAVISSINKVGTEYELSCIERAYHSKNYIYLATKAKLVIVFDIHNFSKGSPEELIEFISMKGIKVK